MFVIRKYSVPNLTFSRFSLLKRYTQIHACLYNCQVENRDERNTLHQKIQKYEDKILYSSYIERRRLKLGYRQNTAVIGKHERLEREKRLKLQTTEPTPLSLKYILQQKQPVEKKPVPEPAVTTQFPFQQSNATISASAHDSALDETVPASVNIADIEIRSRLQILKGSSNNWMTDYENYTDEAIGNEDEWKINYGTPDPSAKVSSVKCGGCGALLHCKDTLIPGYIPSEIFKNHQKRGGTSLHGLICQRCHFLKTYDLALQVRVSADDYPEVIRTIGERKNVLTVLIVDLLDFPCSIWPGIADLLGPKRPIFVIGNKVDLLPQDGKGYLDHIARVLENSVRQSGFRDADIKHVGLISAKTGFGIEELITRLHNFWEYKGDVFLLGCTNVGKSSLFNAFLQSDLCKSQASDLIQRATTSPWPGTTLNLLKFPIMRPTGWRLYVRTKRLMSARRLLAMEEKLRKRGLSLTHSPEYATLIGHIDRTFPPEKEEKETADPFAVQAHANASGRTKVGINEKDKAYVLSKWCYDTPGVVQPDQIIHLLTTEELTLTLPKELLQPRTFSLKPGTTVYIAGLGRLDYAEGKGFARFTVFCSSSLPITICRTEDADDLYQTFLGTGLLAVPVKVSDRLKLWPGLRHAREFAVTGKDWEYSCADVVLSSAGWIAVTCGPGLECKLRTWSPEKRGVYLRESLLPKAVSLRGKKIRDSPAYRHDKIYVRN